MTNVALRRGRNLFTVQSFVGALNKCSSETRSVARKETLGVHQKNWVCHIYCQINAQQKKQKNKHAYWVLIC